LSLVGRILHAIASRPAVYDQIQILAGSAGVHSHLRRHLASHDPRGWLIDVGGGTGLPVDLIPNGSRYLCLDVDPIKLRDFLRKHPSGLAVLADGGRLPIRNTSVDLVLCKSVSHHLDANVLVHLFAECARILKPDGQFLFVDAIWAPKRWQGRILWRYDRGAYHRNEQTLRQMLAADFAVSHWEHFAVHHEYVLAVARPLADPSLPDAP